VDKDKLNMKLLLSALLEADEPGNRAPKKNVMIMPPDEKRGRKANYSFTSDRARMIDMENQRLLQVNSTT